MSYHISPMYLEHVDAVCQLELGSWNRDTILQELAKDNAYLYIATHNSVPIGVIVLWDAASELTIANLAVHPEHRRAHVASRLMLRAIEHATKYNLQSINLEVNCQNTPAIRLYEKFGFEHLYQRPNYYGTDAAIVMQLQTNAANIATVRELVYEGYGLCHSGNRTLFVPFVAAGETIRYTNLSHRKKTHWADVHSIILPGGRCQPRCPLYTQCGGCSYQHLSHDDQIHAKEKILHEIYSHYTDVSYMKTLRSPVDSHYRNKCEFTFGTDDSGQLVLGMHPRRQFFRTLDIDSCLLLPQSMQDLLNQIRQIARQLGLTAYSDRGGIPSGDLHTVTIRYSISQNKPYMLVVFVVRDTADDRFRELCFGIHSPQLRGVLAIEAPRGEMQLITGIPSLSHDVLDRSFVYQAENFFQINSHIMPDLARRLRELVQDTESDLVYDLFAGVGTLGILSVTPDQELLMAESDRTAAELGSFNAELNGIGRYRSEHLNLFAKGWARTLQKNTRHKRSSVIVDPPRAGFSQRTLGEILQLEPQTIIYMSCNPATQRRDVDMLCENGYRLHQLGLVDMFPQTYHIESLAMLSRH